LLRKALNLSLINIKKDKNMFKKLIIAAISASFVCSAAFADSTNVGIRLSAADL
tara:strand:+ start:177 stop:338 length:162 start_codon:yes stop_codon:yes gene_type:complete